MGKLTNTQRIEDLEILNQRQDESIRTLYVVSDNQKKINAQLFELFNQGLGIEDKGELRAKINKVHTRVTKLEEEIENLTFWILGSSLLFVSSFVAVFFILGRVIV